jgi:hypothetical protein
MLTNPATSGTDAFWADDDAVVAWCEENREWIDDQLRALRTERVARSIVELAGGEEGQAGLLKGLQALLEKQVKGLQYCLFDDHASCSSFFEFYDCFLGLFQGCEPPSVTQRRPLTGRT